MIETHFKESLFDYDGPFLFVIENDSDEYIAVKIKDSNRYKYVAVSISPIQLESIKKGEVSVDDIFTTSKEWFLGYFEAGYSNFYIEKQPSSIRDGRLSQYFDGTFYLDPEDYEESQAYASSDSINPYQIESIEDYSTNEPDTQERKHPVYPAKNQHSKLENISIFNGGSTIKTCSLYAFPSDYDYELNSAA